MKRNVEVRKKGKDDNLRVTEDLERPLLDRINDLDKVVAGDEKRVEGQNSKFRALVMEALKEVELERRRSERRFAAIESSLKTIARQVGV